MKPWKNSIPSLQRVMVKPWVMDHALQSLWNACTGCDEAQMKNPDLTRTVYKTEIPDQVEDIKTSAWYPYGGIDRPAESYSMSILPKSRRTCLTCPFPLMILLNQWV